MPKLKNIKPTIGVASLDTATIPKKQTASFYHSKEWVRLASEVIRERGARCQIPGCKSDTARVFCDHIVELNDGGAPLDKNNVQVLCGSHHTKKTIAVRNARMAALHIKT